MLRRLRSHPLSTASCSASFVLSKLHGNLLAVGARYCMLDTGEGKDRQREERWQDSGASTDYQMLQALLQW